MKKISTLLIFLFFVNSVFAQKSIHNYKYIIIPNKFDAFKSFDKYQTSSLTKFLFNKYGYKAYLDSENLPEDFNENKCLALFLDLKDDSGMLRTKTSIVLSDCNTIVVYKSKQGRSKEKDVKKSYHEAIRKAFDDVRALNYNYSPISEKQNTVVVSTPKVIVKPIISPNKVIKKKIEVLLVVVKKRTSSSKRKVEIPSTLYAKVKPFGYQLVDATSKVLYTLLKTTIANVFILKNQNGILYKKEGSWIVEFYKDNKRIQKKYTIEF